MVYSVNKRTCLYVLLSELSTVHYVLVAHIPTTETSSWEISLN